MTDQALKIARDKVIPFLRATVQRHDEAAKLDETKKLQSQAVRQILHDNDLMMAIEGKGVTMTMLMADYEAAGCNAATFIQNIRSKFCSAPAAPPPPPMDDDDIPF